jgi:hypothetical protein
MSSGRGGGSSCSRVCRVSRKRGNTGRTVRGQGCARMAACGSSIRFSPDHVSYILGTQLLASLQQQRTARVVGEYMGGMLST